MTIIVVINFDVLLDKCNKPEVLAAFLKQLNDLRAVIVIQTINDDIKLKIFCGKYLLNPDFFATDNVLIYKKIKDRFEGLKAWTEGYLAKSNIVLKRVVIIDDTVDMKCLFTSTTEVIKVNGTPAYQIRIQEVITQLKSNLEEERKKSLAELDGKITREKAKLYANHELKMITKKRNESEMELFITSAILKILNNSLEKDNKGQSMQPTAVSSNANVMAPYEALWDSIMQELEDAYLNERMDKARTHNGLWMNGESLEWIAKDSETALDNYKKWLRKTLRDEIAKYRTIFVDRLQKSGMTPQKMVELYEQQLEKKNCEKGEYEDAFAQTVERISQEHTTLEAQQRMEKHKALNASVGCFDIVAPSHSETTSTPHPESMSDRSVFKICSGSFIGKRKSTLGSALYDENNQKKILTELKAKIATLGNDFNVNDVDPRKSRTLLHIACSRGLDRIVDYLIKEKNADINLYNAQSLIFPPIFYAIEYVRQHPVQPRVLEVLLEAGVTVNGIRNADGLTALSLAATVGVGDNNAFLVEMFLTWAIEKFADNVDLFVTNSNGRTALLEAAFAGKINVVKTFFRYGFVFSRSDVEKLDGAMHEPILTNYKAYLVDYLKQFGISASDSPTKARKIILPRTSTYECKVKIYPCATQLQGLLEKYSVKTGSPNGKSGFDIVDERSPRKGSLVQVVTKIPIPFLSRSSSLPKEMPADRVEPTSESINALEQGYAPLHVACVTGHMGLFDELCKHSPDLQKSSKEGFPPLYYAVMQGHSTVVGKLLDKLAGNKVPLGMLSDGRSYLHCAVESGDPQTIINIIQKAKTTHQASYINRRNKRGNTALMEAILTANKELIYAFWQNNIGLSAVDLGNLVILIEEQSNKQEIKIAIKELFTKELELLAEKLVAQQHAVAQNSKCC